MRFVWGPPPNSLSDEALASGQWRRVKTLPLWVLHVLSLPVGVLTALAVFVAWALWTPRFEIEFAPPWQVVAVTVGTLVLAILIQAVVHPDLGLSKNSLIGLWPSRVTFYTCHLQPLTKRLYILRLLAPFVLLGVGPLLAVLALSTPSGWLFFISCLTAFATGLNVFLALWSAIQLPAGAMVAGRAFDMYCKAGED